MRMEEGKDWRGGKIEKGEGKWEMQILDDCTNARKVEIEYRYFLPFGIDTF